MMGQGGATASTESATAVGASCVQAAPASSLSSGTGPDDSQGGPVGIGGWLVLPAIGLIVGGGLTSIDIVQGIGYASNIPQQYAATFAMQLLCEVGMVAFTGLAAYRFFAKKRSAPGTMIGLMLTGLVLSVLLLIAGISSSFDALAAENAKNLFRQIIGASIWIPYFLNSKRVRNTFVQPDSRTPSLEAPSADPAVDARIETVSPAPFAE